MRRTRPKRGFTLIELLVVILMIGILIGIVLTVGANVMSGGKSRQTADTIRTVDTAVETYIRDVGRTPPAFVLAFRPGRPEQFPLDGDDFAAYPLADAVDVTPGGDANRTRINSIGLFIRAAEEIGLEDIFAGVSSRLLVRWDGDFDLVESSGSPPSAPGRQPELRTILDAWGQPLRFVHPAWDGIITEQDNQGVRRATGRFGNSVRPITANTNDLGADFWLPANRAPENFDPGNSNDFPIRQIRRDRLTDEDRSNWSLTGVTPIGDGDGGYTIGGRPYIYSAGPDGDPSTTDNNVYTTTPRFAAE